MPDLSKATLINSTILSLSADNSCSNLFLDKNGIHLIRKYSIEQIRFWRTSENYEVDFIVEESFGKGFALELKWNNQKPHKKGFQKFMETYPEFPISQSGIEDFFKYI